jgi:hypothetical protein
MSEDGKDAYKDILIIRGRVSPICTTPMQKLLPI